MICVAIGAKIAKTMRSAKAVGIMICKNLLCSKNGLGAMLQARFLVLQAGFIFPWGVAAERFEYAVEISNTAKSAGLCNGGYV